VGDLYDPLTIPPDLVKADHQKLDRENNYKVVHVYSLQFVTISGKIHQIKKPLPGEEAALFWRYCGHH
jgi:hypothetical protein